MMNATLRGKPDSGNLRVRFDDEAVALAKLRHGSLFYKIALMIGTCSAVVKLLAVQVESGAFVFECYPDTDTATLTQYTGNSSSVIIPSQVSCTVTKYVYDPDDGKTKPHEVTHSCAVNYITGSAFRNNTTLTRVILSSSVKRIAQECFSGCSALTSVHLHSVEAIEYGAFKGCSALTTVDIPSSVTTLGGGVFESCTNLKEVNFHNGPMADIPTRLFCGCINLIKVPIDLSHVSSVGNYAFAGCERMELNSVSFLKLGR